MKGLGLAVEPERIEMNPRPDLSSYAIADAITLLAERGCRQQVFELSVATQNAFEAARIAKELNESGSGVFMLVQINWEWLGKKIDRWELTGRNAERQITIWSSGAMGE